MDSSELTNSLSSIYDNLEVSMTVLGETIVESTKRQISIEDTRKIKNALLAASKTIEQAFTAVKKYRGSNFSTSQE